MSDTPKIKEYTQDDLTVIWNASKCIHAGNCARGLSSVFKPKSRPWINMEGADNDTIAAQVDKCPSGALSYRRNG